jgi:protein-tyrosine phosphatase
VFLVLGASAVLIAVLMGGGAAVAPAWFALSYGSVGVAYLGRPILVFGKDRVTGRIPFRRKVLLFPYLVTTAGLWHVLRLLGRERPYARMAPGLYVGRRLLSREYPAGIRTVVDLTFELDARRPLDPGVSYENIPVLDGACLSPTELRDVGARVATLRQPIYLHCAQGHGRTAMVAASVLLALGLAESGERALEDILAARPGARTNRAQRSAALALTAAIPGGAAPLTSGSARGAAPRALV